MGTEMEISSIIQIQKELSKFIFARHPLLGKSISRDRAEME
jgi:hypothetical protein